MNTKIKEVQGLIYNSNKMKIMSATITARVTKDDRGATLSLADESGTGIMIAIPLEEIKKML